MDRTSVKVSILCLTYNHEQYIKDALYGFLNQKTNFDYEILVHDDASTDRTQEILHDFEEKYPEKLSVIYQKENQYSKGVKIEEIYQVSRAKGKYIALCEGDDYWIDDFKLQKQFDEMERHPELDICAHGYIQMDCGSKKKTEKVLYSEKTIIPVENIIMGGGGYVATNSLFYRKSIHDDEPEFRKISSLDYTLQVLGSLRGGMLYLPDTMSVYRYMSDGSWSKKMMNNKKRKLDLNKSWIRLLSQMDMDTGYKYTSQFGKRMLLSCITPYETFSNNLKLLKIKKNSFHMLSGKQKLVILSKIYCPHLYLFRYGMIVRKY